MAKPPIPTDVGNYRHEAAKRRNIPTAENQGLVPDDEKNLKVLRYPRNPDLDPQLVWRGKDAEDSAPLEVTAPPIYIQEKIHPRALIENLRRQSDARKAEGAPQFDFFHDFNGLEADPEARTEFYAHDQNWQNRMILGDSLLVMGSLAEREALRGKVQCIYFDPPYGIKFNSNWQPSTKSRDVKDGKEDSVSREPEVVRAFRDTWKDGINSYLSYLRDRIIIARDLLAQSGCIFVQIGDENVHRVRVLLDEIFGSENFVSSISVKKTSGATGDYLSGTVDHIVFYAKSFSSLKYRQLYIARTLGDDGDTTYTYYQDDDGTRRRLNSTELAKVAESEGAGRVFRQQTMTSQAVGRAKGEGAASWFPVQISGREIRPPQTARWKTNEDGMRRLIAARRIEPTGSSISYIRFHGDFPVFPITDLWADTQSGSAMEKVYVVQTSQKIIERCILMATDPGDLVLDPTCGSGTTAYVAENWGRRWITVDTSRVALTLARARLMGAKFDYFHLADSKDGASEEGKLTARPPAEGPFTNDIRHGFVYKRAPHVTLKSIANNLEIDVIWDRYEAQMAPCLGRLNVELGTKWEEWQVPREAGKGWSETAKLEHAAWWELRRARQKEVDESIARNADVEYLYDQPIKAKGIVRVSGPFTVESLSPHRVLPLGEDPFLAELSEGDDDAHTEALRQATSAEPSSDFAQVVYDNLVASGVQNTKKGEAIKFEWLKPRVSRSGLVPFEGRYTENGELKRAAICIGPEYDTVGYDLVKKAAREAADLYDTLIVCGFAFAPEVDETRLNFGSLTVLKARMNQDLRMGDKLKATGAGNLFVIFGEPDLRVMKAEGDMIRVEIRGMDIFDPTTGEVRSSGGSELRNDVAAWFIDDDYDEESFFVRQAYFVGQDPYDSLKRALKAEIDETAWDEMNATISRPFPRPQSGRICVKVINHFGDEVQKVFEV
ncbi:site-specific DNA-methyltransferase [Prosthecomicrobium hirschii]|uniref:site-specific DNA-methyltransferase n=1 Tax=Prosthecodimorpha hirschii TaxID=665126 RepID=UPI00112BFEB7|nr:site-specific DNA-methyltransferase [Prosthecomicrobium hirschii]MCW1841571.1 site-specific DNA-methyltransferase [Prosthecomicrobium hirschii]TPQ49384.1 site-specific DNA-methyltransferase [Prosthecomicrobium hirschii]